MVSTGNNCNIHMANRDIINNVLTENRNAIEDSEAWEALFNCITEDNALKLVEIVKDPRYQTYFDQNIKGKKKWITDKFKKLSIHSINPKAKAFVEIHKEVLHTIDSFVKSKKDP